jgi:hypothetical protein
MPETMPYGYAACPACGFPVRTRRGREYCSGACRVRMLRVKAGLMTPGRAVDLAREARERAARVRAGLPAKPVTRKREP